MKTYPVTTKGKTVRVTVPPREDEPGWRGRCPDCGEPTHGNVCEATRSRNAEIKKLRTLLTKAHYALQDPDAARSHESALCAEIRETLGKGA